MTADLKTIAASDCYGIACITALTVQSTKGVRRLEAVAEDVIRETLEELASDFKIAAVHIGMLGTANAVAEVSDFLERHKLSHVVLDPVLRASSGANLLEKEGIQLMLAKLMPQASVITPNLDEASALTGLEVTNVEQMRRAARKLHAIGGAAIVITGGHLDPAVDLLSYAGERGTIQEEFRGAQLHSRSTHGTGCAFATSLACHLARGTSLLEAVPLAKAYVTAAIANAYPLGEGIGPLNHFYGMVKKG